MRKITRIYTASLMLFFINNLLSSDLLDKNTLIEIAKSYQETLETFECKYTCKVKLLSGFNQVYKNIDYPIKINKDGYNQISSYNYKRKYNAFYVLHQDITDGPDSNAGEYHSDGNIWWSSRPGSDKEVYILQEKPGILTPLYDNILLMAPVEINDYTDIKPHYATMQSLLLDKENVTEINTNSDNSIDLKIYKPCSLLNLRNKVNAKMIYRWTIDLQPEPRIKSYSVGAYYKSGDQEYLFHPQMQVDFSDYNKNANGIPSLPEKITMTQYRSKDHFIYDNINDEIKADKQGSMVPIQEYSITLDSLVLNPTFAPGEVEFKYPPGTPVFDQFAHRSYIIGDTLESLRKKIEPMPTP